MSQIELKPCPFCGGPAKHNNGGNSVYGRFWWAVGCSDCDVVFNDREEWHEFNGPLSGQLKFEAKECFARWNARTPENEAAERAAALERKVEARIAVLEQACGAAAVAMYLDMTGEQIAESEPGSPFMLACAAVGLDPISAPEKVISLAAKIRADGHIKGPKLAIDSDEKLIRVIVDFLRDRDEGVMPDEIDEGERAGSAHEILQRIADVSALEVWKPTHRHVKRGSEYRCAGVAKIQTEIPLKDMDLVVVYQDRDGHKWARRAAEFKDPRFEPVNQEGK